MQRNQKSKGKAWSHKKGAQIVLVSDVHGNRPRADFHQHNPHPKIPGINTQGNLEVRRVMSGILPLVKGELQG
jgi:hypothetical protein